MFDRVLPNINKILIIRNDGIGDLLNSTPAIALLRKTYPNAELTALVQPLNAPVLVGNPHIDRLLSFDRRGPHQCLRARLKFYGQLRCENFDLAIAMRTGSWPNFVSFLSGARYRLGRNRKRFRSTLTHAWRGKYRKGAVHEVDRNLELVGLVCDGVGDRRIVFNLLEGEVSSAEKRLFEWGIGSGDLLVCLHPGASSFDKRWPEESYAQIADKLVREYNAKILILRGPHEVDLSRKIQDIMAFSSIAYGPESIRELGALLKCCDLVVCNDSGPMHIAAALHVPMVSIFGPTDHVVWKPLSEKATVVRRDMPCWPCSSHKCTISWECTKKMPVDMVWDEVERTIGESN